MTHAEHLRSAAKIVTWQSSRFPILHIGSISRFLLQAISRKRLKN
jgi:hypothetical protein